MLFFLCLFLQFIYGAIINNRKLLPNYSLICLLNTKMKESNKMNALFRYVLPEIIDKEIYNKEKEESIAMIGEEQEKGDNISQQKLLKLQFKLTVIQLIN